MIQKWNIFSIKPRATKFEISCMYSSHGWRCYAAFLCVFHSFSPSGPSVDYGPFGCYWKWQVYAEVFGIIGNVGNGCDWNWTENADVKSSASDLEWMLLEVFACKHELTIDLGENQTCHSTLSLSRWKKNPTIAKTKKAALWSCWLQEFLCQSSNWTQKPTQQCSMVLDCLQSYWIHYDCFLHKSSWRMHCNEERHAEWSYSGRQQPFVNSACKPAKA